MHMYTLRDVLVVALPPAVYDHAVQDLQTDILTQIAETSAAVLIIDVAPVDLIDRFFAQTMLDLCKMAALLGAHPIITGIDSPTAAVLATFGLDMPDLDLVGSVSDALAQLGVTNTEPIPRG